MKRFWKVLLAFLIIGSVAKAQSIKQVIPFKLEASNSEAGVTISWEKFKDIDVSAYRLEKLDEDWNYQLVEEVAGSVFRTIDIEPVNGENFNRLVAELKSGELVSSELFIAAYFEASNSNEVFDSFTLAQIDSIVKSKLFTVDYINPMMVMTRIKMTTHSLFTDYLITSNNLESVDR